ncbi:MAG: peptidyl-prolyl cis-trans isomerase [Calditrichaeota bacterium]|nr:MAG: peptidyl-prolyl cis-trans isomerase [Calditrichota bacterium]
MLKKYKLLAGYSILSGLLCLFFSLSFYACSDKNDIDSKQQVIARVGDRVITLDEFKYSYEFSFAPLRAGNNPKKVYLDYMIKELLLANEGYSNGLNHSPYVISRINRRKRNDLLEAFYHKYVYGRVNIPEDKLQDATKKATVKWRMIMWPVNSREEALQIRQETQNSSLKDYIGEQLKKQDVPLKNQKFFETDWLDFYDMRPEFLNSIEDLEIGKTSEPIPYGDGFLLVQILDINLHGIKEDELKYGVKREKMRQRLFDVQADSISSAVMDSVLTPREVRLKGPVLEQIVPLLYQWIQDGLPRYDSLLETIEQPADTAAEYIKSLGEMLDQSLVTTIDSSISVRDYLDYMNYYRKTLNQSSSEKDFRSRFITEVGRMIKNKTFIAIAEKEGFADSSAIRTDLEKWERKWTYDLQRYKFIQGLDVSDDELQDFYKNRWRELQIADIDSTRLYKYEDEAYNMLLHEKHMAVINVKLKELKQRYPVWINKELLQQIDVDSSSKSQEISVFVSKKFSGEFAVPTADIKWIHYK